jgi:hypothetical protein
MVDKLDRCATAGVNTTIERTTEANIAFIEIFPSNRLDCIAEIQY